MKKEIKNLLIIFLLLIMGTVSVIYYNLYLQNNKNKEKEMVIPETTQEIIEKNIYRIGNIIIDKNKEEIFFSGKVAKTTGWVQFLIYVDGYKWLEDETAIIAEARLKDLQLSLALLDWKYWDDFYYEKKAEDTDIKTTGTKWEFSIQWRENDKFKMIKPNEIVTTKDKKDLLTLHHFIFLGDPLFDQIALSNESTTSCQGCPFFPVEEKTLRRLFKRKSGESGYEINTEVMPPLNTEISIIIKKSKIP
jgi:hypothetical protein